MLRGEVKRLLEDWNNCIADSRTRDDLREEAKSLDREPLPAEERIEEFCNLEAHGWQNVSYANMIIRSDMIHAIVPIHTGL